MRINREKLLEQLESVMPGLSPREIIQQSSCFIFKKKKVVTYNDEIACTQDCLLPFEGAVQAKPLIDILRKLKEDTIEVDTKDGELLIKGKNKRMGITMDAEILLPIETVENPEEWANLPDDFADAISIVQHCASGDETRFALTCIHLHPKWIESCDAHQAARYMTEMPIEKPILVRKDSIKYIVSLDMTEISETESWVHFRSPANLILSCRRWEEDFPELTDILKVTGTPTQFPKGLVDAIDKAQVFSTENAEENQITIELQPDKLRITGRGVNGYYKEITQIKYKGKPLAFQIAPQLLADLIKRHNSCEILIDKIKVAAGKYTYVSVLQAKE